MDSEKTKNLDKIYKRKNFYMLDNRSGILFIEGEHIMCLIITGFCLEALLDHEALQVYLV